MSTLTITKHMGRLGNNMTYIINAIDYCIENNINRLIFNKPIHSNNHHINILIHGDSIDINIDEKRKNSKKKNESQWGHYFYRDNVPFFKRKEIALKYIVPKLKITPQKINNNALVIHIRGGDIFSRGHYAYIQPPISFYEKIINSKKWEKIYLISEDNKNPCLEILKNKYNCISSLDNKERNGKNNWGFNEDLSIMLGATNFVASKSSLSPLIIQLSKTIKNIYLADYFIDEPRDRESNYEKGENQIWWSSDLSGKNGNFEYHNLNFFVSDYKKYIKLFDKTNFDLSHPENKHLLLIN